MEDNNDQVELISQGDPTPDELVVKIKDYMKQTRQNIIEIGILLIQAKKQVPHGEWASWLATNIDFTIRTADRFMKCAERFSNWTPASNLNSSQMFELLALKQADAESFVTSKANEGTSIESMSKKTLRDEIKKWKLDHKKNAKHEDTQSVDTEINISELKKLEHFLNLANQLAEFQNLDVVIKKFATDNADKMGTYSYNLKKIMDHFAFANEQ